MTYIVSSGTLSLYTLTLSSRVFDVESLCLSVLCRSDRIPAAKRNKRPRGGTNVLASCVGGWRGVAVQVGSRTKRGVCRGHKAVVSVDHKNTCLQRPPLTECLARHAQTFTGARPTPRQLISLTGRPPCVGLATPRYDSETQLAKSKTLGLITIIKLVIVPAQPAKTAPNSIFVKLIFL